MTSASGDEGFISWPSFVEELGTCVLSPQLIEGFVSFTPFPVDHHASVGDRWILASNLHKAIRFGLVEQAAATAEELLRCDPAYFWNRLPVIALEDVSLGNLGACLAVLGLGRDLTLRRKFQGMGLAGYLGSRLAATSKCRSVCDLLSLVYAQRGQASVDAEIRGLDQDGAYDAACSKSAALRERTAAFLRLDRLPIRKGNARAATLTAVGEELKLPAQVTQALVTGNATYGLNALLPLVYELAAERPLRMATAEVEAGTEFLDGPILCAAADQYTRIGRSAMKQWLTTCRDVSGHLAQCGIVRGEVSVIGMALFHIEGSLLNRRLTNDCLDLLREETEYTEMAGFGLTRGGADTLYDLMRRDLPVLNDIRRRLWRA